MPSDDLSLVCRVRTQLCALPLEIVSETMRPLPIERVAGVPASVRGVAIIRGAPTPVVDLASLLTNEDSHPTRFVVVRYGQRRVALAVDSVIGVRAIPSNALSDLPPLLASGNREAIAAVSALDAAFLTVLDSTRLLSDEIWRALDAGRGSA